ncbi:ankyrin repeat domain-containing protein [Rothia sp. CCM 9419]|uniref:ankyrin repeat domain-containing protein n=1 Tax=Rothia sp. CCM 9419 TaxID=3402662 RepID=UPI003AE77EE4
MTDLTPAEIDLLNRVFDLAREGNTEELEPLLNQGIPANLTNAKGDTLLILASYHQQLDVVELLLTHQADVNRLNDRGQTALLCAVFKNSQDIAQRLLNAGADLTIGVQHPLEVAQFFQLKEMQQLIEEHQKQG